MDILQAKTLRAILRDRRDQMTEVLLDRSADDMACAEARGALAAYRVMLADIDRISEEQHVVDIRDATISFIRRQ